MTDSKLEKPTLWHSRNARSLRPLWALEEMGLDYELVVLRFPPRVHHREFLRRNVLGTVPYFVDGEVEMTESVAICHFLVQRYHRPELAIAPDDAEYGDFLNWLYHADATLTFPQTLILRYGKFEPAKRRQPQVVEDYRKWFLARLRRLDAHIDGRDYLCGDRFTIADVAVGYALYLGRLQGMAGSYTPQVSDYLARLEARPAFGRAVAMGADAAAGD